MNTTRRLNTVFTFAASVAVGCGAALAIASVAAVSQAAPSLRPALQSAPVDVVRLQPVVVTVSKATFDAVRAETAVARTNDARKVARG